MAGAARRLDVADVVRAAVVAGVGSGLPSTLHALATGRDPLEATRAAGTLLITEDAPAGLRLIAGVAVHAAMSAGWAAVVLPVARRVERPALVGAALGVVIAAIDLTVARRRFPAVAALPTLPQVADHAAFGALAATTHRGA